MSPPLEMVVTIFLWLDVAFLLGTAIWFRLDHARNKSRFQRNSDNGPVDNESALLLLLQQLQENVFIEESQWQYSLRSNLLLWGCVLAGYLLVIGETAFFYCVLWCLLHNQCRDGSDLYISQCTTLFQSTKGTPNGCYYHLYSLCYLLFFTVA